MNSEAILWIETEDYWLWQDLETYWPYDGWELDPPTGDQLNIPV